MLTLEFLEKHRYRQRDSNKRDIQSIFNFFGKDDCECDTSSSPSESNFHVRSHKKTLVKKVPLIQWDDVEHETVDCLPAGIDGTKVYVIDGFTTKNKNSLKLLNDGRRWKKNCPTNWQGHT